MRFFSFCSGLLFLYLYPCVKVEKIRMLKAGLKQCEGEMKVRRECNQTAGKEIDTEKETEEE